MKHNYSFSEFKKENRENLNELIILTLKHINEKEYKILDKRKLLKHLIEYIYISSDIEKFNV